MISAKQARMMMPSYDNKNEKIYYYIEKKIYPYIKEAVDNDKCSMKLFINPIEDFDGFDIYDIFSKLRSYGYEVGFDKRYENDKIYINTNIDKFVIDISW